MYEPDHEDEGQPTGIAEKASVLIFVLLFMGLFAADIIVNFQPVKLSALFVVLFWIPLLALHEFGHAAMAWAVGWKVHRVVIGFGGLYWKFPLKGAIVEIRQIPISGYVLCRPSNLIFPRLKDFLVYFAGPGSELLLSLAVLLLVGPERMFQITGNYFLIFCQSLAVAGAVQGFINLVPYYIMTPSRTIANDGMGMVQSFFQPDHYYASMLDRNRDLNNQWDDSDQE